MASIDQQINDFVSPATHWVESVVFYAVDVNDVGLPLVLPWPSA